MCTTFYRFQSAQENTDSRNSRGISPYAEFHQLVGESGLKSQPEVNGVKQMRPPLPTKAYIRSTSEGRINRTNYDFLHSGSGSPIDSYDYLITPNQGPSTVSQSPQTQQQQFGGHEGTPPQQTTILSGSPRDRRSSSVDHLGVTRSGLKHRRIYEQLSPKDGDDADTYVYMAPLKDFPEGAKMEQELAASPAKAKVDVSGGNTALDSSSELRLVST